MFGQLSPTCYRINDNPLDWYDSLCGPLVFVASGQWYCVWLSVCLFARTKTLGKWRWPALPSSAISELLVPFSLTVLFWLAPCPCRHHLFAPLRERLWISAEKETSWAQRKANIKVGWSRLSYGCQLDRRTSLELLVRDAMAIYFAVLRCFSDSWWVSAAHGDCFCGTLFIVVSQSCFSHNPFLILVLLLIVSILLLLLLLLSNCILAEKPTRTWSVQISSFKLSSKRENDRTQTTSCEPTKHIL